MKRKLEMIGRTGGTVKIDDGALADLRGVFRGEILAPDDPGYDAARVIFNGMFDRRPGLIARCSGTADVIDAVRFARRHDLLVSVRGGGHNVAGLALSDGVLTIDLSSMRGVHVDRTARTVRVQGGATWGDVDRETQAFGLATPGGIVSHTGVAGLTLNGGLGWLRNKHGLSCDNLVSADVVTAEGECLRVDAGENADLFWALRGGGGNFGVVTSFEFRLHPVGPDVAVVFSMYPLGEARSVLRRWRDWVLASPDEVSSEVVLWTMPDIDGPPPEARGRDVAIAAAVHAGDPEEGMRVLQPLRELGEPIAEILGPLPFRGVQTAFDPHFPNTGEMRAYWKSLYLDELGEEVIETMADRAANRSVSSTMVFVQHLGNGIRRVPSGETAFAAREAPFVMDFMGTWREDGETDRHVEWIRDAWNRLRPHSNGTVYLNYENTEELDRDTLVRSAFGANYERLVETKTKYDPDNVFRLNQNVLPAGKIAGVA